MGTTRNTMKGAVRIAMAASTRRCGARTASNAASKLAAPIFHPFGLHARTITMTRPLRATEFKLADIGEGIKEGEVLSIVVKVGDVIDEFDPICEVQSDKANVEITSRYAGKITKINIEEGGIAQVGSVLLEIEQPGGDIAASEPEQASVDAPAAVAAPAVAVGSATAAETSAGGKVLTTPAVRRIAKENNVDLTMVPATGPNGRILKGDILAFLEGGGTAVPAATPQPSTPAPALTPVPRPSLAGTVEPVRGLKRAMVNKMNVALTIPAFGYKDEISVLELGKLRKRFKARAIERGHGFSYMPFFIKATSLALKEYPILNSSLSADQSEIHYHASHNVSLAVDSPNGLIVPNIKDVQDKTLFEIAADLKRLTDLAKDGKLGADDLSGGTITLSNIGVIGGTYAKPVIMSPEVMIGAIGKVQRLPRFAVDDDGQEIVVADEIVNVSWEADHRILDGATVARFSQLYKGYLEDPETMLLEMR